MQRALIVACFALSARSLHAQRDFDAGFELIGQRKWAEAAAVFDSLARSNPADGRHQYFLGLSRARLGECDRAIPALSRAIALGLGGVRFGIQQARIVLAGCAAMTGAADVALAHLDTAWQSDGLRDFEQFKSLPRFVSILGTPRFRALAGIPEQPITDRAARWRFDVAYLDRLVRLTHPAPFRVIPEVAWRAEVARIGERIPALSDDQIIADLMRLVARVGDGHTALYPRLGGPDAWQLLPIWPVALADGWYVGAASPAHRALVGARIVGAGDQSIEAIERAARALIPADNEETARWLAQVPLQFAQMYQSLGASNADGSVALRVVGADGREDRVTLQASPIDRDPQARWAPADWPSMTTASAPRWLGYASADAAIEWMPREKVLYVALNTIADTAGRSLAALGEAVRDSVRRRKPSGIILDLRLNNGGNGNLVPVFVRPLLELPLLQEAGALQVLTGPRTFSAAGALLAELDRFTEAERVGWPTGVRPVTYGTETPFRLPLSGLGGTVATRLELRGRDAMDTRPFFPPRELVWPTGADVRAGRDPVVDAALRRIATRPRP